MLDHIQCLNHVGDFGLCPQCVVHFLKPQSEDIFTQSTEAIIEDNLRNLARALHVTHGSPIYESHRTVLKFTQGSPQLLCPCCFGAISYDQLDFLTEKIVSTLLARDVYSCSPDTPVCLEVIVPPVLDAFRITSRTVFTRHPEKLFPYPNIDELLVRIFTARLKGRLNIVSPVAAKVKITLHASVEHQLEFCEAMWSDFKIKKIKRRFGMPSTNTSSAADLTAIAAEGDEPMVEEEVISRKSVDSLLMHYKTLDSAGYADLHSRLARYMSTISLLSTSDASNASANTGTENGDSYKFRWKVTSTSCPVYLLGRYRKLARDVPQSPWTVSVNGKGREDDDGNGDDDAIAPAEKSARLEGNEQDGEKMDTSEDANASAGVTLSAESKVKGPAGSTITYARKGRCSVEEIINSVVKEHLQAAECRMHPCGREDIDVRCLGNGRPFAMEVLNPRIVSPDSSLLKEIQNIINRGEGLNAAKDVEVALLTQAERTVWETMQTKAEEKRKGYCCVVWSERPLTRDMLTSLEQRSTSGEDVDETGEACIELNQKTPLRVLHRRSLLDRKRHVYKIETALLNKHFFLMRLVTSAGTYVKEFVHGDMGRTTPSVSSIFQCQADIMQLDVTWLYDDFEGNTGTSSNNPSSSADSNTTSQDIAGGKTGNVVTEGVMDGVIDGVMYREGSMDSMSWEVLSTLNTL